MERIQLSRERVVTYCCGHCCDLGDLTISGEFIDQLSDNQLLLELVSLNGN